MASVNVLPPISAQERGMESSIASRSLTARFPASKQNQAMKASVEILSKNTSKKEQELIDPKSYRHSIFHNTCTSLLKDGYHESFSELFCLVEQQRAEHEQAGPAAILLPPLVENSRDKLDLLRRGMSSAEEAKRCSDLDTAYLGLRELALHFEETGDRWLADHFHHRCLETGHNIKGDNRKKEGEAHFHVSLSYENRGELDDSLDHMLTFHQLARSHRWHTEDGNSMHRIACEHLQRIYTKMADQASIPADSIKLLQKAHAVAKEGGNTYKEGLTSHKLGLAYESTNDFDTAIQCHKSYLERCRYHGDTERMGEAYNALARCYEQKGDLETAVQNLELYVGVAEKTGLTKPLAKACSAAGIMFNTIGDYGKAVEYFQRCYKLCDELGDKEAMKDARVQCGIAQTHNTIELFNNVFGDRSTVSLCKIMAWKAGRMLPNRTEKRDSEETDDEEEKDRESEVRKEESEVVEKHCDTIDKEQSL